MGRLKHNGEILLDIEETIEVTGCSTSYIYRLVRAGKLQNIKVEGSYGMKFTLKSVVNYLSSKRFRRGLGDKDLVSAFHQLDRRVQTLEARVRRRDKIEGLINPGSDQISQVAVEDEVRRRHPDFFN